MKKGDKEYSLILASTVLLSFLILFSSSESVSAIQSDSLPEYAYVPNEKTNDISVINTTTNKVISTIPVENNPVGVAVNRDGTRVYVTNSGNDTNRGYRFSIIYTNTHKVENKLVYAGEGVKPFGIAITPDETLYIASYVTGKVYAVNLRADNSTPINVGIHPIGVVVTPDGSKVYVANKGSNDVSVINTTKNNVIATVNVGSEPYGVAASSDGRVYVTNQNSSSVSVINTATNNVTTTVNVGIYPHGVAVTPDGSKVYVANQNPYYGSVSVINTTTYVTKDVPVDGIPCGVAVTSDGKWVYVTTSDSAFDPGSVYIINTITNEVTGSSISVGVLPSGLGQFIGPVPGSKIETITTLVPSPNQNPDGKPITLIATVNSMSQGTEIPSGKVIFTDGTKSIENGDRDLTSGQATLETSYLSIGSHSIVARYTGNNNFRPSTSSSFTLTVPESFETPTPLPDGDYGFMSSISAVVASIIGAIALIISAYIKKRK